MSQDELVSANRRKFMVAIQPAGIMRDPKPQVIIINAFSLAQARRIAIRKASQGKYKHRTPRMWEITSCEEMPDDPNN